MKPALIGQLLDVLQVEERVHRELRQILARERECMLQLEAEGLYELVRRKDALADEGRLAADARRLAAQRLARALGLDDDPITLSRLCEALGEESAPLRDAQSRLLSLVTATRELAEANRSLGGERLCHVQTTLQLLGRLAPDPTSGAAPRPGRLVRTSA